MNSLKQRLFQSVGGFALAEQIIALGVIGIALLATMQSISFIQHENRASSQRMLAASIQTEMLSLFKTLPYTQITNSTVGVPVYLKRLNDGTGDPRWQAPVANDWLPIPVEDVNSGSAADPANVADKLPGGVWSVRFTDDPADATLRQITVTVQWRLYAGGHQSPATVSASTIVSQSFPNL